METHVFPDRAVVGCLQAQFDNVRGLVSLAGNPLGEGRRQLRIDEEVHVGCSTA